MALTLTIEELEPISGVVESTRTITAVAVEQGPPGAGGAAAFQQMAPATTWGPFVHGLGFHPAVTVTDDAGNVLLAAVQHVDVNTVTVQLDRVLTGWVYVS